MNEKSSKNKWIFPVRYKYVKKKKKIIIKLKYLQCTRHLMC